MLFYNQKSTLETMGIQLHRSSMDKHTNNNGYRLVEICKNNNLTILNGRFGRDKGIGRMTFRNTSVIDYAISSIKGLTLLTDFEVIETDILHSDGHSLNVDIPFCSNKTNLKANKPRRRATWKQAESRTFVENLNQVGIEEVTRLLHVFKGSPSQHSLDAAVNKLSEAFLSSADASFPQNPIAYIRAYSRNKPWFGPQCKHARKVYNQAKKNYNKCRTILNKIALQRASKIYKTH